MASVKIPTIIWFLLISILAFSIYLLTKGPPPGQDHYVWLASAFLHGKLGISNSGLEELVNWHGNYYVVYPPGPAVLLMPFVAVFGTSFDESLLSIILASISVSVTWLMLRKVGANKNKALWLTVLFGFGTCLWFIASVGSSWYIAEVVAVLFLTSAIVLTLYQKSYALIGLLLGLATLARLTVVLAFPFFLFIVYERNSTWKPRFKQAAVFLIALAIPLILYVAYNMVRYGTVLDIGYNIIIKNDPNYPYGLYSIYYLPKHIYAIFFQGPFVYLLFHTLNPIGWD
jgi:4-amino-4-deoxy-L-arabinose transferase-like glycosyltransferase